MGLSVADDDDDSPIPSPSTSAALWTQFRRPDEDSGITAEPLELRVSADQTGTLPLRLPTSLRRPVAVSRKRLFDVESLLAPDADKMDDEPEVNEPKVIKPEVVPPRQEIDSTTDPLKHRGVFPVPPPDRKFCAQSPEVHGPLKHRGIFPVSPPDRKYRPQSPEVDNDNVIVGPHQLIRADICDNDVTTTSGKQIADNKVDVVTSLNSVSGQKLIDRQETGSRFLSTRQRIDDETASGETTSGLCADPELARLWMRHASMASSRFARAFFPLPLTAYHVTHMDADVRRARDINQGQGLFQGPGQGRGERQFGGQVMENFRKLSESASPPADDKNRVSPVDVI